MSPNARPSDVLTAVLADGAPWAPSPVDRSEGGAPSAPPSAVPRALASIAAQARAEAVAHAARIVAESEVPAGGE
jgi:hypothetical protein